MVLDAEGIEEQTGKLLEIYRLRDVPLRSPPNVVAADTHSA
jgi:peptide subunit release factor RF-3